MSKIPSNLKYEPENHLWVDVDDDIAYIGITDYAQDQLGELLFVELPEEDETYQSGDIFSSVESGKNDQELSAPFEMEVIEINESLDEEPELINEEPYENWICKVRVINPNDLEDLIDADSYQERIEE